MSTDFNRSENLGACPYIHMATNLRNPIASPCPDSYLLKDKTIRTDANIMMNDDSIGMG